MEEESAIRKLKFDEIVELGLRQVEENSGVVTTEEKRGLYRALETLQRQALDHLHQDRLQIVDITVQLAKAIGKVANLDVLREKRYTGVKPRLYEPEKPKSQEKKPELPAYSPPALRLYNPGPQEPMPELPDLSDQKPECKHRPGTTERIVEDAFQACFDLVEARNNRDAGKIADAIAAVKGYNSVLRMQHYAGKISATCLDSYYAAVHIACSHHATAAAQSVLQWVRQTRAGHDEGMVIG